MRKTIILFLLSLALLLCPAIALADDGPALNCKSALLLDGASGEVLFALNSDAQCYPASVTKIMTLTLILEAVDAGTIQLTDDVVVSAEAAAMGGSQVYLYEGEVRTVDEMLIAIAVGSGNDAAYAMAEFVGGTYDGFIELMNSRAQELGMTGTHFVNPHGLHDENHYTTAADLGRLAYHALSVPHFLDYTSIYEYEFRPEPKKLVLWNTNRLLKWYEGTDGMKTGYTEEAGRNLVATAQRNGMRLISVVLGCSERQGHFQESMDLLNYGFNSFSYQQLYAAGDIIAEAAVSKGAADSVPLVVAEDVGYTTTKNSSAEITETLNIANVLKAPVQAGDIGGSLTLYKDGELWRSVDLVAANDVAKGGLWRTWGKLLAAMW